jgi:hypothetical protein
VLLLYLETPFACQAIVRLIVMIKGIIFSFCMKADHPDSVGVVVDFAIMRAFRIFL